MRVDNWTLLERFLILGSEESTYRVGKREWNVEAMTGVQACLKTDGPRVVRTLLDGSSRDPALFVLALAASPNFGDAETNALALQALPRVVRTGAQLCKFAAFSNDLRGWGRGLRSAVADWYVQKPAAELAYQVVAQHQGEWSHRDLLRLSHPKAASAAHNALFQWAVDGELGHLATAEILDSQLRPIHAFELARKAGSEDEVAHLVEDYRLTAEMIPSKWKNSARVWETLLHSMPYSDVVRNLGQMTAVGLLQPQSPTTALVVARLVDRKRVANSKLHPITLLDAFRTYRKGGETPQWSPVGDVSEALNEAYYLAFENIRPSGKRIYLALDGSSSLGKSACLGMPSLSAGMAALAMSMIFTKTEPNCTVATFRHLREAASLPFEDALGRGMSVEAFVFLSDQGVWASQQDSRPALDRYREATGIRAKLVVIAMAADHCTMTDPNDPLQLGVAGFDATVPEVVAEFVNGHSLTLARQSSA